MLRHHFRVATAFAAAAVVLAATSIALSAAGTRAPRQADPVRASQCDAADIIGRNVALATQEARARSAQTLQYVHEQRQKADAEKKNGRNEILASFERTGFKMDVPEVTVGQNKTRVPTVHVAMRRKSMHVWAPSQCKIGSTKIPEFRGYKVTFRSRDILVPCTVKKEVFFDLPEFRSGTTEVLLPSVRVEIQTREFSLHLPQFTERTPENEMRKHDRNIDAELARLARDLNLIESHYMAKARTEILQLLKETETDVLLYLDWSEQAVLESLAQKKHEATRKIEVAAKAILQVSAPDAEAALGQIEIVAAAVDRAASEARDVFAARRTDIRKVFEDLLEQYSYRAASKPGECKAADTVIR